LGWGLRGAHFGAVLQMATWFGAGVGSEGDRSPAVMAAFGG
jgi:hypothetical protein